MSDSGGKALSIVYLLRANDEETHRLEVRLDPESLEQIHRDTSPPPWAKLETDQCDGCPLKSSNSPFCPAATSLAAVLEDAGDFISYSEVEARVQVAGRVVSASVRMQDVMSSFVGLCMATSGCPNLAFLKPMARFHVPFATMEETIFRATSSYLLGQYFRHKYTGEDDYSLDGLEAAYRRVHQVNVGMANRLRHVSEGDANLNAIVKLDMFTHELPYVIGRELEGLAPYFRDYWEDREEPGRA
jgi:hypothetical protein